MDRNQKSWRFSAKKMANRPTRCGHDFFVVALEILQKSSYPLVSHYNDLQDVITMIITLLIMIILIGDRA